MVGIVSQYTSSSWERDMNSAKSYGIDGFALNIGQDAYTNTQLGLAYAAAEKIGFKVFISFDVSTFKTRREGGNHAD
jgi:glucan endo-1,3-alpha-glucosidase